MTDLVIPDQAGRRRGFGFAGLLAVTCFAFLGLIVVLAVFGSLIAPHDPGAQDLVLGLTKPSGDHWLGTDELGRDVFSRLIAGARTALVGPVVIALGSILIGNGLGLLAGYRGGWLDAVIMRCADLMFSLPSLLVIIVVAGTFGGGYWLSVVLLIALNAPFDARIIRGATLEQAPRAYVEAARSVGLSDTKIMIRHIWPNVAPIAVANACLVFAGSLVSLAGLSFLGLGVAPGTPDWGLMVSEGRSLLFTNPVGVLAPAAMIVLTATAMNLSGDWVYDRLSAQGANR
ncbi:peptide/nickel transport system permease protein [Amycolatopsis sulphurea]|uniref:Peptide/nickel transport system permease protein n=1 Tax=Amycolatopsis sulphurea TaxID=76022 RepID=A0A2A9FC36_9PSEU|nr:ABC transporter permease [Amycolatopsis sulphurea]PFG47999.1 peptide/nickel transport system permease protein [Amycolatopsis sulphurea]